MDIEPTKPGVPCRGGGRDVRCRGQGAGRRGSRGQITVFFVWQMFMSVAFVAVTLNVWQMLVYHTHLQTSVDCASYSGAVIQARGLNEIARINNRIMEMLRSYQRTVSRGIYASYAAGMAAATAAKAAFMSLNASLTAQQMRTNIQGASESIAEARQVANANQAGFGSVEFMGLTGGRSQITELRRIRGDSVNFSFRYYYYVTIRVGPGRYITVRRVGSSGGPSVTAYVYEKGTSNHAYLCGRIRRAKESFLFRLGDLFPADFRDVRTYATAMPFGGRLWDGNRGRPAYDVKLVRTGEVRPAPDIPDRWGFEW